jgi:transcriptional regulator with XRE-family HTH domain
MDVSLLIRNRLGELGLEQKDLASAVQVTESYVSQLLSRKKAPPAPGRTDLYDKIGEYLKLPKGELSKLADVQRQEELKTQTAFQRVPGFDSAKVRPPKTKRNCEDF